MLRLDSFRVIFALISTAASLAPAHATADPGAHALNSLMPRLCRDEDVIRCDDDFLSYVGKWGVPPATQLERYEAGIIASLCTTLHPDSQKDWGSDRYYCFNNALEDSTFPNLKKIIADCRKWKHYASYEEQVAAASCYETRLMSFHDSGAEPAPASCESKLAAAEQRLLGLNPAVAQGQALKKEIETIFESVKSLTAAPAK